MGVVRVLVRWEFYRRNFLGFVQLAATASPYDSFEVFEIDLAECNVDQNKSSALLAPRYGSC